MVLEHLAPRVHPPDPLQRGNLRCDAALVAVCDIAHFQEPTGGRRTRTAGINDCCLLLTYAPCELVTAPMLRTYAPCELVTVPMLTTYVPCELVTALMVMTYVPCELVTTLMVMTYVACELVTALMLATYVACELVTVPMLTTYVACELTATNPVIIYLPPPKAKKATHQPPLNPQQASRPINRLSSTVSRLP